MGWFPKEVVARLPPSLAAAVSLSPTAHGTQIAPLDIFFTMAVPDGAPKEAPDASDTQQEPNNSDNLEDNGGSQMTLSSDEVNYLIFR